MLKLTILTLIAIVACNAVMTGNFRKAEITDTVKEVADWATTKISALTGVNGVYTIESISDVKTQVVAGINYLLTINYSIVDENNNVTKTTCQIKVFDQPWTKTREIVSSSCQ